MKITRNLFTLLAVAVMMLTTVTNAQAQKKPKPSKQKGLAKEIIATWKLDDIDLKIDESKATDEEKQQFTMAQAMMGMMKEQMKGKISFTFNADNSYTSVSETEGEKKEEKGKWALVGDKLSFKPDSAETDMPESFEASIVDKKLNMKAPMQKGSNTSMIMKFVK